MTPQEIRDFLLERGFSADTNDTYAKYDGQNSMMFSVGESQVKFGSYWRSRDEHHWNTVYHFKIMSGSNREYVTEILRQHGFIGGKA